MTENKGALFIGVLPCGLSYADRRREEHGDYAKVAFLPYRTLRLEVYNKKSDLLPAINLDAASYKPGQRFQISSSGQFVVLGTN